MVHMDLEMNSSTNLFKECSNLVLNDKFLNYFFIFTLKINNVIRTTRGSKGYPWGQKIHGTRTEYELISR